MKGDKIRAIFEGIDKAKGRYSSKLCQKAKDLLKARYKEHSERYKVKSNMEYNAEFNE